MPNHQLEIHKDWRKLPRLGAWVAFVGERSVYITWDNIEYHVCYCDQAETEWSGANVWAYEIRPDGTEHILARHYASKDDNKALKSQDRRWQEWLNRGPEFVLSLGDICMEPADPVVTFQNEHFGKAADT